MDIKEWENESWENENRNYSNNELRDLSKHQSPSYSVLLYLFVCFFLSLFSLSFSVTQSMLPLYAYKNLVQKSLSFYSLCTIQNHMIFPLLYLVQRKWYFLCREYSLSYVCCELFSMFKIVSCVFHALKKRRIFCVLSSKKSKDIFFRWKREK